MKSNKKYVIGLDFGTDSCRELVVDTYTARMKKERSSMRPCTRNIFNLQSLLKQLTKYTNH